MNATPSARWGCARRLAVRARVKRVSSDQSVTNVLAATVASIVRNVLVMPEAPCRAVNVNPIVNARYVGLHSEYCVV